MTQALTSKSVHYIAAKKFMGEDVRKVFDSLAAALAAAKSIYSIENFPASFPLVIAGVGLVDVTGDDSIPPFDNWPEDAKTAFLAEGVRVALGFIGVRGLTDPTDKTKEINGARGFIVYPMPSLSAIRAVERGESWLTKLAEKEASHVSLRGLRNVNPALGVDALAAAAMQMPLSVEDIVEGSTSESLDTAAFDSLWADFRKMLSASPTTAPLVVALPPKAEVIKCIRSSAYAMENQPGLEERKAFAWIGVTMADVIDNMRAQASAEGKEFAVESDELRAWVAGRDSFVFPAKAKAVADLSTLSLTSDFASALFASSTPAPEAGENASAE